MLVEKQSSPPLIHLDKVCFGFGGSYLFHQLDFLLQDPNFFLFTGSNGVGKTTLFLLMLGFLKPKSGSIKILGKSPQKARELIGYVPQRSSISSIPVKVIDVVASAFVNPRTFGLGSLKKDSQKAEEVLVSLGLEDLMKKNFFDLSGGQAQQVLLARAVALPKKILLLDEPMSNTDSHAKEMFYQTLNDLYKKGVSIILISHDLSSFSKHDGKMMFLNNQKLQIYESFNAMEKELFHYIK